MLASGVPLSERCVGIVPVSAEGHWPEDALLDIFYDGLCTLQCRRIGLRVGFRRQVPRMAEWQFRMDRRAE